MDNYLLRMRNVRLEETPNLESDDPRKRRYRGVIASTGMNTQYFRKSREVIEALSKQADSRDIKVLQRHSTYRDPIGHSVSAVLKDDKIISDFDIGKDLQNPDSNDIIRKMDLGIYDSLSTGTRGGRMNCDVCSTDMKLKMLGWFSAGFVCQNEHILSSMHDGKRVTAELFNSEVDPIRLVEYSVCPIGANKDAKLLQEINKQILSGELDNYQLGMLCEINDMNYSEFRLELADNPTPTQVPVGIDLNNPGGNMAFEKLDEMLSLDLSALKNNPDFKDLAETIETRLTEAGDYVKAEVESNISANSEELDRQLQVANAKIVELEDAAKENEALIETGKSAIERMRNSARAALRARFGENYAVHPEGKAKLAEINDPALSYKELETKNDAFWSIARNQRPTGKKTQTPSYVPQEDKSDFKFTGVNNIPV